MKRSLFAGAALFAAAMLPAGANAQDTIKIGVISAYSGQFADTAAQIDNGIKLYMKQHGDTVAGKKIEIIRKDTGGPNPDVAKRLAQELIVRDKADILAGLSDCCWWDALSAEDHPALRRPIPALRVYGGGGSGGDCASRLVHQR